MKALILALVVLGVVLAAPTVAADDDPVCGDMGAKNCAFHLYEELFGCNPLYNYFQECQPDPTS